MTEGTKGTKGPNAGGTGASALIEVRDARSPAELRACQTVQRVAWGIVEDGYLVPVATMVSVQKVGGLVLGAFEGERPVGFSFAFLGRLHGQLVLYSQLTAVLPDLQGRGVGRALKLEQRRRAAAMGLETIVWAFDPLQASNAFFNLATLGATSRTYEVDLYGPRTDRLNAGLATDRLLVEWSTSGDRAGLHDRWPDGVELIETAPVADGHLRQPVRTVPPGGALRLHAEIPADLAAAKAAGQGLALAWQEAVRTALQSAFADGYVAVGFARGPRPCYLLERPA